jgi:LmbE family N-acetylglucosaminyl deacetylase
MTALGRLLVVSPHLDDAVFACGGVLASYPDATVLTVFAGDQPPDQSLTGWDRDCGFAEGDDVMRSRRAEDEAALELLHATPIRLAFLDAQYAATPSIPTLARVLHEEIARSQPDTLMFPLGLFHSDHCAVHEAVLHLLQHFTGACYAYEDALYRRLDDRLDERLSLLRQAGWRTTRLTFPTSAHALTLKRQAAQCYRSQLAGLATPGRPGLADIEQPEAYWQIRHIESAHAGSR